MPTTGAKAAGAATIWALAALRGSLSPGALKPPPRRGWLACGAGGVIGHPGAAPEPRSELEAAHRRKVDWALRTFWTEARQGYAISLDDERTIQLAAASEGCASLDAAGGPETYGEITAEGARQLGRAMHMDDPGDEPVIFFDLGSGVGKLVAQAFLEWPRVISATGVELSADRAARAQLAWDCLCADGDAAELRRGALTLSAATLAPAMGGTYRGGVHPVHGDIFSVDVAAATHVYVASLCFTEAMMSRLAERLASEAVSLLWLATLRPFPSGLPGFEQSSVINVEMSWSSRSGSGQGQDTFLYRRVKP